MQGRLRRALPLEFRKDAAFCQRDVLRLLAARRCAYAIKVGYWSSLPLKALAAAREQWEPLAIVKVTAHPEGSALDEEERRLFVACCDKAEVVVIDWERWFNVSR